MSYSPKITIPGLPTQQLKKIRIAGQTQVVDSLIKRVVLLNRETMQLIAARNVASDNTWELFAPDQGDENHILIGMDEGGNFNVDAFDKASLGVKTFSVDPADYADVLSNAEAFYVTDVFYADLNELPYPVMLPGELSLENPTADLYFIEDLISGHGHFEDGAGTTVLVGRPQDTIREGTKIVIGGLTYTVVFIENNGAGTAAVELDFCVAAAEPDVLGDGSCIGYMPMQKSWIDVLGEIQAIPSGAPFNVFYPQNYNPYGLELARSLVGVKTITFKTITDELSSSRGIPLLHISNVLLISWYDYHEYINVKTWVGGTYTNNNYTIGSGIEAFISIVFGADNLKIYVNDNATPKREASSHALLPEDQIYLYGDALEFFDYAENYHASMWDLRFFDKELSSTEMGLVEASAFSFSSYPIAVSEILSAGIEDNVLNTFENRAIPYTSNFEQFSPFYGTALNTLIFEKKAQLYFAPMELVEIANNVLHVPGDYANPQLAIDAAQNNDVIKIQPGNYNGQYTVANKIVHFYGDESGTVKFNRIYQPFLYDFQNAGNDVKGRISVFFVNIDFQQDSTYYDYGCFRIGSYTSSKITINLINSYLLNTGNCIRFTDDKYILLKMLNCTLSATSAGEHVRDLNGQNQLIMEKCHVLQDPFNQAANERVIASDYVTEYTPGYGKIALEDVQRFVPAKINQVNPIYFSIPAAAVNEDLQNVQVPIDLSPYPNIFETVSSVSEISVIFQDGRFLNVEVESWDAGLEKGLLWVALPYISSDSDTHYAVVYPHVAGLTGTLSDEVIQAVWDDFLFAYHMGYDPVGSGSCKDSTANENHATPLNMAPGDKSFALLGAYEYSYDGADQYLNAGNLLPEKTMAGAMEIVFKTAVTTGFLVSQDADGWNDRDVNIAIGKPTGISNTITDGHLVFEAKGPKVSETNYIVSTAPVNDNAYHHAGLSWYRENLGLTLDGAIDVPQIEYKMWGADGSTDIQIGSDGTGFFNGAVNDVMLSKKFHSAPWHEMFNKNLNGSLVQYAAEATDWLGTWQCRIPLTIDHTKIDSDLTHFPVPIVLTGTDATTVIIEVGGNNKKIAVALPDKSQLYCEIEQWDAVNDKITLWVSRSDLVISSTEDTTLYLYYDGAQDENLDYVGDPGDAVAQNVWNSDFVAVYHLGENLFDSTVNAKHLTNYGSTVVEGLLGNARSFDGVNDHAMTTGVLADLSAFNISGNFYIRGPGDRSYNRVVDFYNPGGGGSFGLYWDSDAADLDYGFFPAASNGSGTPILNEWQVWNGKFDSGTAYFHENAIQKNTGSMGAISGTYGVCLGSKHYDQSAEDESDVIIDEVRISSIARSDDWIKVDYHAQTNTLLTAGTVQEFGAMPAVIVFNAFQVVQNLPVKIDLSSASGADGVDMTGLIEADFTNLQVTCNAVPVKAEAAYWDGGTRAIIWALIPETVEGESTLALEYLETASDTIGGIGSTVGQEVWQDFEAVYHLCQDPSVAIKDSTGNHANAVPANMDATNLVDGAIVFNGTDEAINIGNIFDTQQDRGQVHVGFKTAENSGVILSQGDSDMVLDASGNLIVTGTQTETSLDVLSDDAWHGGSFAFHRGKRDFFVDGVDQIPYGLFGSTGATDILIGGHYTVGAAFTGNIVDVRLNNDDPGHQALSLRGKVWKETLEPYTDIIDMIPIFSFDEAASTYKIWDGAAWRAIVSKDDAVHGVTSDTDWHYRDGADVWSKVDAANFNEAAEKAIAYPENQNDTLTIEALTSAQWTSTGGMTSDGYFNMAFVFSSPIDNLYPAIENVYADDAKQIFSDAANLEPYNGKITGSKIEWSIKITDPTYDFSQVKVYACLTGSTWTECTRNEAIPGITAGMDTTGLTLQFKITTPVDYPNESKIILTPKIN